MDLFGRLHRSLKHGFQRTIMLIKWIIFIAVVLMAAIGLVTWYADYQWQLGTNRLRAQLTAAQQSIQPKTYNSKEIEGLPLTVQRFFRAVLKDGQPIVAAVNLSQQGQMNMSETEAKWCPFTATQFVVTQRPGFDWDARIQMALGIITFVHDRYCSGEGYLKASLMGLFTMADSHGTPAANQGELLRFFAEMPWYPTALLPSQGVVWEAIDDTSAQGTLTDGETTVSLLFRFNAEGLIETIRAEERYRGLVVMPWEGRFWHYTVRDGMQIPLEGEVAWLLPAGAWPYWRGRVTEISYEFVPSTKLPA
jgi:hypothetical protein